MISIFFFIAKRSIVYGIIAFAFSFVGIFLSDSVIVGNPLEVSNITIEHVSGHIIWGLVVGIVSFSFRYGILAGLFPIFLDFDHWIQFLGIEMIPRMGHSIPFALIAIAIMMLIFGKKDLRLGAICFASVLTHISFDIFLGGWSEFPFFAPFTTQVYTFAGYDWIIFQISAMIIVAIASVISIIQEKKLKLKFSS